MGTVLQALAGDFLGLGAEVLRGHAGIEEAAEEWLDHRAEDNDCASVMVFSRCIFGWIGVMGEALTEFVAMPCT